MILTIGLPNMVSLWHQVRSQTSRNFDEAYSGRDEIAAPQETMMSKNPNLTLSGPDLAALLCSRVCYDVISPVGAINNGLELLDEGGADADAMDLIRTSALNASVRLKFARLAFGASGSVGASIDTGEAERAAKDFAVAEKKTEVIWNGPRAIVAKNRVKLLLNLFLVAYSAIPRGGVLEVTLENPEFDARFKLTVKGKLMRLPPKFVEISTGSIEEAIDAHSIQPYYTVLLAQECGMTLEHSASADELVFTAVAAAA
jgi:histidine phosphotransferase ChpT